jgi:drug/metabolite transporter (DMT)-like permease
LDYCCTITRLLTNTLSQRRLGFWLALIGAVAFAGKAIIVKMLLREGVDPISVLGLRMLLAAPVFALMALRARPAQPTRLTLRELGRIALLGFTGYYLASSLDFMGLALISASLERLILYGYPTLVLLLGRLRGGPAIRPRQWAALGLSYAGVIVAFGGEAQRTLASASATHDVLVGSALVLASAVSYAMYIVLSGETVERFGALRLTGLASSVASFFCVAQFALLRPQLLATIPHWVTPRIWLLSSINASVCTAMPMWMLMRAIELIGSGEAAQIGMVGPLSTILLAALLLGEHLTLPMIAGTVLVMLGIGLLSRR